MKVKPSIIKACPDLISGTFQVSMRESGASSISHVLSTRAFRQHRLLLTDPSTGRLCRNAQVKLNGRQCQRCRQLNIARMWVLPSRGWPCPRADVRGQNYSSRGANAFRLTVIYKS
jgi:hypothetical protein